MKVDITKCSRCGGDHNDLDAMSLTNPIVILNGGGIINYWAICPDLEEPILIQSLDEE